MARIGIKRTYEPVSGSDGWRILVERLWPRGLRKEDLHANAWEKGVAPSPALRKWYAHDVSRWPEFQLRYRKELNENPEPWRRILDVARSREVTLLFSARDVEHNSAVALRDYLMTQMAPEGALPPEAAAGSSDNASLGSEVRGDGLAKKEDDATRQPHLDALLDEALRETFPASDPVAISFEICG